MAKTEKSNKKDFFMKKRNQSIPDLSFFNKKNKNVFHEKLVSFLKDKGLFSKFIYIEIYKIYEFSNNFFS
jgi:hypothetical protein